MTDHTQGKAPILRAFLVHTGGTLWVSASGMSGAADPNPMMFWPGSPVIELGPVPSALKALPQLWEGALSHFVVELEGGEAPGGNSGQLAVALGALLAWHAVQTGQEWVQAGLAPPSGAGQVLLTASGTIEAVTEHGALSWRVGGVEGWPAKVAQAVRLCRQERAQGLHIFCPLGQRDLVSAALVDGVPELEGAGPGSWTDRVTGAVVAVHGVTTCGGLLRALQALAPGRPGRGVATPTTLAPGHSLGDGRYLLEEPLGRGGFGEVWRALDRHTGDRVAVKVLGPRHAASPASVTAFLDGARRMQELGGAGILPVHAWGQDGLHHWFAMPLMTGGTLADAVVSGRCSASSALEALLAAAEGLARAHKRHLVHRDITPLNILLDGEGQASLADFDSMATLAELQGTRADLVGSFAYVAPEVMQRPEAASPRSDVYSLAMVGLFVLSRAPLDWRAVKEPVEQLLEVETDDGIKAVLGRAMGPVEHRQRDAGEFAATLRRALEGGTAVPFVTERSLLKRRARVRGWTAAIALLIAFGVLAAAALWKERQATVASYQRAAWQRAETDPGAALALLRAAQALTLERGEDAPLDLESTERLMEHGAAVQVVPLDSPGLSLAASPDGALLAVGTLGGVVHVVDVKLGETVATWDIGSEWIWELAWAPDRALVAARPSSSGRTSTSGLVVVVDVERDQTTHLDTTAKCLSFGPGGVLYLAGPEQTVAWDLSEGLERWRAPGFAALSCTPSHDGRFLVLAGARESPRLLDARTGTALEWPLPVPTEARVAAWLGPSAALVMGSRQAIWSLDLDKRVAQGPVPATITRLYPAPMGVHALGWSHHAEPELFSTTPLATVGRLSNDGGGAEGLSFSRDGNLLAWGTHNGRVLVRRTTDLEAVRSLEGHLRHVYATAFVGDPARPLLATASGDRTLRLWRDVTEDVQQRSVRRIAPEVERGVGRPPVALSPDGRWVATTNGEGGLRVVGVDGSLQEFAALSDQGLTHLAFTDGGQALAARWSDDARGVLAVGPSGPGALEASPISGGGGSTSGLSPSGALLVAAFRQQFHLWDRTSGTESVFSAPAEWAKVKHFIWADGGGKLLVPTEGDLVQVRDLAGQTWESPLEVGGVTLSSSAQPGSDRVALGGRYGSVEVWDVTGGELLWRAQGHNDDVIAISWSPDGRWLATASWDGTAAIWDSGSGALHHRLVGHRRQLTALAWSQDSQQLVTAGKDQAIRVWSVQTGTVQAILQGHDLPILGVAFQAGTPSTLVSVDGETLRTWAVPPAGSTRDLLAETGVATNLRVCRGGTRVVPDPGALPSSVWAGAEACAGGDRTAERN